MSGFVYLFRNGELYNIGFAENLELSKKQLRPDAVLAALASDDFEKVHKRLSERYEEVRLPQSDYFRLSKSQAEECQALLLKAGGKENIRPFFSGFRLVLTFLIAWFGLTGLIIKGLLEPIFDQFS